MHLKLAGLGFIFVVVGCGGRNRDSQTCPSGVCMDGDADLGETQSDASLGDSGGQASFCDSDAGLSDAGRMFLTCTPPGHPQLVNGGTVGPTSDPGACQKPVERSSLPCGRVFSFGTHPVGDVIAFAVPEHTASISLVFQAVSALDLFTVGTGPGSYQVTNTVVPKTVVEPNGNAIYVDATPSSDPPTATIWYRAGSTGTGIMTLPNSSAMLTELATNGGQFPTGMWQFTVNDYANECSEIPGCSGGDSTGTYDVKVILGGGPVPSTGTVDVDIYLATTTLTATDALTDPHVARFVETFSTLYGRGGLCLGKVTFYDLPAWARNKYATGVDATDQGSCSALDQLFTLSKSGTNALNIFFVDDIGQGSGNNGGTLSGIDGAIPGPSSISGTVKSGAVVNVSNLTHALTQDACSGAPNFSLCGADTTAYLAAHEGGHWMGLYHNTEAGGDATNLNLGYWGVDPLSDTPSCTCSSVCVGAASTGCLTTSSTAIPSGGFTYVVADFCNGKSHDDADVGQPNSGPDNPACGGADNLMFWLADSNSTGNLSSQQGMVIRSNPVVQ